MSYQQVILLSLGQPTFDNLYNLSGLHTHTNYNHMYGLNVLPITSLWDSICKLSSAWGYKTTEFLPLHPFWTLTKNRETGSHQAGPSTQVDKLPSILLGWTENDGYVLERDK